MSKVTIPKPVAAMWQNKHGGLMMPTTEFSGWPPFEPLTEFHALITSTQAEAYKDACVREALEKAESVVRSNAEACSNLAVKMMLYSNADAIRALL